MRINAVGLALCGLLTIVGLVGQGCSSTPKPSATISLPGRLLVLTPKVVFEDARSETVLTAWAPQGVDISQALAAGAVESLRACGAQSVEEAKNAHLSPEQRTCAEMISVSANRLFLSSPSASVLSNLHALASSEQPIAVLVQFAKFKVGIGRMPIANAPRGLEKLALRPGDIEADASSTHLRAAIFDCQSGRLIWQNSIYTRDLLILGSSAFVKAVQSLYTTLQIQH